MINFVFDILAPYRMKTILKSSIFVALIAAMLVILFFSACERVDDPTIDLKDVSLGEWPLTDCSTSTRPVRDLVAYKLLGVPYKWEVDWMSGTTYIIQPDFSGTKTSFSDAEMGEDVAEDFVGGELSCYGAEVGQGGAQILCYELC